MEGLRFKRAAAEQGAAKQETVQSTASDSLSDDEIRNLVGPAIVATAKYISEWANKDITEKEEELRGMAEAAYGCGDMRAFDEYARLANNLTLERLSKK